MKWKTLITRSRSWLGRAADTVPPTARGCCVALLAAFSLWTYGYGSLDLVLFVVGIAGLVLFMMTGVTVATTAYLLRRRLDGSDPVVWRQQLEAGSLIRTGFRAPALERVPLVKISWEWLEPSGIDCRQRRKGSSLVEEVVAHRRCLAAALVRRFTVRDVFGLTRVAWTRRYPTPLTVLPDTGRLRNMPVVQSLAAGEGLPHPAGAPEGDRMEIRRYTPGDSVRNILWKTFAKTGQLNVRLPEKSVDRARRTVAYLVAGEDDEPAAAAARVALEGGALGERWLFGADGTSEPSDRLDEALEAIARSGSFKANGHPSSGLAGFLDRVGAEGDVHCIVFTAARPGGWTPEVLRLASSFPGSLSFVLGTDGVDRNGYRPLWRRLLFVEPPSQGTPAEDLSTLLRSLSAVRGVVQVVDRTSGRTFGEGHQRALGMLGP